MGVLGGPVAGTEAVAVGGAAVGVGDGAPLPPPQAAASASKNIREASVSFTSLMLLSRPALGH